MVELAVHDLNASDQPGEPGVRLSAPSAVPAIAMVFVLSVLATITFRRLGP
jgi:hypothetical protein